MKIIIIIVIIIFIWWLISKNNKENNIAVDNNNNNNNESTSNQRKLREQGDIILRKYEEKSQNDNQEALNHYHKNHLTQIPKNSSNKRRALINSKITLDHQLATIDYKVNIKIQDIKKKYLNKFLNGKFHRLYIPVNETNNKYFTNMTLVSKSITHKQFPKVSKLLRLCSYNFNKLNKRIDYIKNSSYFRNNIKLLKFKMGYIKGIRKIQSDYHNTKLGNKGEFYILHKLESNKKINNKNIYTNVNLDYRYKNKKGRPNNQNDILVSNKHGMYCLEVKNYQGISLKINNKGYLCEKFSHNDKWHPQCNIRKQIKNHIFSINKALPWPYNKKKCVHGVLVYIENKHTHFKPSSYDRYNNFAIKNQYEIGSYITQNGFPSIWSDNEATDIWDKIKFKKDEPFKHYEFSNDFSVIQYAKGIFILYQLIKRADYKKAMIYKTLEQ